MRSVIFICAALALAGCASVAAPTPAPVHHHRPQPVAVQNPALDVPSSVSYLLTGSARAADITYTSEGGGTRQQQGVSVPTENADTGAPGIEFEAEPGSFLYFSAQNQGGGTLTCQITVDGSVVDEETSSGQYAIVTCQGTA